MIPVAAFCNLNISLADSDVTAANIMGLLKKLS